MKARYTEYYCAPVGIERTLDEYGIAQDNYVRLDESEADIADAWGVYGLNPDETSQHIGDACDRDGAESLVALLNWLIAPEGSNAV